MNCNEILPIWKETKPVRFAWPRIKENGEVIERKPHKRDNEQEREIERERECSLFWCRAHWLFCTACKLRAYKCLAIHIFNVYNIIKTHNINIPQDKFIVPATLTAIKNLLNAVYRILPITFLLLITTCQILQGIAKSTPQRKAAPTCFNKEYIIAAWWRFEQKKNCFSRRPSAVPLRREDPTTRGCSGDFKIKLTVRRCLMIKTNVCAWEWDKRRRQEIDASQQHSAPNARAHNTVTTITK